MPILFSFSAQPLGFSASRPFVLACAEYVPHPLTLNSTHLAYLSQVTPSGTRAYTLNPAELGIPRCRLEDLKGGDAATNAAILRRGNSRNSRLCSIHTRVVISYLLAEPLLS